MSVPAYFFWKDSFAVGIPEIDAQHERFFEIFNLLYATTVAGSGSTPVRAIYHDLNTLAALHFSAEEALLEGIGYPGLERHRGQHAEFMAQLARLPLLQQTQPVLSFLRSWLLEHILGMDKAWSIWMNASAGSQVAPAPSPEV